MWYKESGDEETPSLLRCPHTGAPCGFRITPCHRIVSSDNKPYVHPCRERNLLRVCLHAFGPESRWIQKSIKKILDFRVLWGIVAMWKSSVRKTNCVHVVKKKQKKKTTSIKDGLTTTLWVPKESVLFAVHPWLQLERGILSKRWDNEAEQQSHQDKHGR